jgi:hypothetical protein
MFGFNSFNPGVHVVHDKNSAVRLTVHSVTALDASASSLPNTSRGRLQMLWVLLVCAAPVVASYFTYFVVRPEGRTNYSELIEPARPVPEALSLSSLQGQVVKASSLKGQWLLVVVAGSACNDPCERLLWIQRQLRETLGRDKDRLDKVWLVTDAGSPRPSTLQAISGGTPTTILKVDPTALLQWLSAAPGQGLQNHMFVVDPLGHWMMRVPANPDPSQLKRDVAKLMRASAGWDKAGR